MKRAVILLFVLTASCRLYKPVVVQPDPTGVLGERPNSPRTAEPCREIARVHCAVDECKGPNMDYVTLSCSGGREVMRCVASLQCSTE